MSLVKLYVAGPTGRLADFLAKEKGGCTTYPARGIWWNEGTLFDEPTTVIEVLCPELEALGVVELARSFLRNQGSSEKAIAYAIQLGPAGIVPVQEPATCKQASARLDQTGSALNNKEEA
jgi:hypothetical protein